MSIITEDKIFSLVSPLLENNTGKIAHVTIDKDKIRVLVTVNPDDGAKLENLRQKIQQVLENEDGVQSAQIILTAERDNPPALNIKQPAQNGRGFSHKISNRPVAPRVKHMIAVASGKGGVGKSTIAAHLARAFHALGYKTGLCDADIYGASQPLMMGIHIKPETRSDDMIIPPVKDGLAVISMGFFVDREAPIIWRGPMVHSAIQQLLRDVDWGDLDILVIDLPPGTGDAQLSLAQYVPLSGAVIISTPQDAALSQAKKGLKMFEKTNVPVLGIIENMRGHSCSQCGHIDDIFGTGHVASFAKETNTEYLGAIPLLNSLAQHADHGTEDPAISTLMQGIAARIVLKLNQQKKPVQRFT